MTCYQDITATMGERCSRQQKKALWPEHFVLMFSIPALTRKHGVTTIWPSSVSAVAFTSAIAAHTLFVDCLWDW